MIAQLSEDYRWLLGLVLGGILLPTWMAWWNAHVNRKNVMQAMQDAEIARKEVTRNGGSSLKDEVISLAVELKHQGIKQDTILAVQELHSAQIATITENQAKTQVTILAEQVRGAI